LTKPARIVFFTLDRILLIPDAVYLLTASGSVTVYVLFVMELSTRRVRFAGSIANSNKPWMLHIARNVSDAEDGFLREKKYLRMDWDTKFSEAFQGILQEAGWQRSVIPSQIDPVR
jgi:hypothetical protein